MSIAKLPQYVKAILFDMDGVLYDSMPGHAKSWMALCNEVGIDAQYNEFFAHEGRTGASIINILYKRQFGHGVSAEEARRLYAIKGRFFTSLGPAPLMAGAADAVHEAATRGITTVLVTGSGQASLLDKLDVDYPGIFSPSHRVTALDVRHGKPDPEPYLVGLAKAGVRPDQAIAIDNAPLGVESASRAGIFTIGVRTGPIPADALSSAGADIEVVGMNAVARLLQQL